MDFGHAIERLDVSEVVPKFRSTTEILECLDLVKSGISCGKASKQTRVTRGTLEYWVKRENLPDPEQIIAKHLRHTVPRMIDISDYFAKLAGAYVSEGHSQYDESKCRYQVKITNNNSKFIEEVQSSWINVFPHVPISQIKNNLQMNGKVVSALFSTLFGSISGRKCIPDAIYGFDDEKLANFLMMCFEGDGWVVPENNELAYSSKSLKLVDGLATLLSRWGIITTIRERRIDGSSYYDMTVLPKHVPHFAKRSRFLSDQKQNRLERLAGCIAKRSRWDGIDVIPGIKNLLQSVIREYHMSSRKNPKLRKLAANFRVYMDYENIGREKLRNSLCTILDEFGFKSDAFMKLEKIVESDIFFDKVVEINEIKPDSEYVYDLSVDRTENFVAGIGNVIAHNSSVMQGIAFALFGTFSALGSKKLGLDDLIMAKPNAKGEASVEVEFTEGGKEYAVKRTVEKGKGTTSAEIRENGKLLEVNPQGVTREVQRILRMDYDLFQRAVYSEQNALDYFLQIPKGRRMQQIDEMLKLDRYEKARESAVYVKNRIADRRKDMLKLIEEMKERNLAGKLSELLDEIRTLEKEKRALEDALGSADRERKKLSEAVVKYEASHDLLNEASKRSGVLSSRIAEMKRQIDGKKQKLKGSAINAEILKAMATNITKLEVKLDDTEGRIRTLRDGVSSKNARMLMLRDQSKEAKLKLSASKENELKLSKLARLMGEAPDKKFEAMLKSVDALRGKVCSLEAEKKETEKSLKELKDAGEKCPVCESRLTQDRKRELLGHRMKHLGGFDIRISEAKDRLGKESASAEHFRKSMLEYERVKRDLKDLDVLKEKIADNSSKASVLVKEVKGFVSEIRRMEKEEKKTRLLLDTARLGRSRGEAMLREKEELESLISERDALEKQLSDVSKQAKVLGRKLKGKDIKSMRAALQESVGRTRSMEARLGEMEKRLKDKKAASAEMEEQAAALARYQKGAGSFGKIADSMDAFVSVLRSTQDQLRDEFLKTVNYIMNDVWSELYPYGDFGEIRLLVEKDYVLQLKGTKGWMNAEMVSGGERSLACLALRIAFSLAFTPNIRWLILDEPTHNLDANAIEHFGSVLKDRMENIIEQVFLITHEERLSDYITGSTYRLERDKEADGVTRVTEI
jgi:exonuclease SbcC